MAKFTTIADFTRRLRTSDRSPNDTPLTPMQAKTDILSGLTVALALVPEAIAFAIIAGVAPLVGLHAAFIIGLITAVFGGRPGMISGATGALAVVMVTLVAEHGVEYLFATVILMGTFQVLAGVFKLGKFMRLVPHPVMLGFVNGLAIVIFWAQMDFFQIEDSDGHHVWMSGITLWITLALVALTMLLIWITPKITRAIPAPLVAITLVAALVIIFDIDVLSVGDLSSVKGGLPTFSIPNIPLTFETLFIILPYAFILGSIGLIESLLTLNLVGDITGKKGGASQECLAQGGANIVTGLFGGMGGCAMIGQSMINVKSGGRTRLAGIAAALFLLSFILFASGIIDLIPLAALVGVMFMVVIGTFAWQSIKLMGRIPASDILVILIVTAVTVSFNLAIAVFVGVIISALVYAWNAASQIQVHARLSETEKGAIVYELSGPLFFGSTTRFQELFEPENDPDTVIIDFSGSRVVDHSALQAIDAIAAKYELAGKKLMLRHLSRDCHALLAKAGQLIVDMDDDPSYRIATDYGILAGKIGSH
ncbi:SulP family inorganic anion transporter [Amylibacter sp.]|nr:SulP family inorganic anion transporter [Amylibacter sp.]